MQIRIKFFATLKDITKNGEDILQIDCNSINIDTEFLKHKICKTYGISEDKIFAMAVNGVLGMKIIKDGDTVSVHPVYRGG